VEEGGREPARPSEVVSVDTKCWVNGARSGTCPARRWTGSFTLCSSNPTGSAGTHFDAPVHWITGKDLAENACDTIPARRFVGPAAVLDVTAEVEANPDFLLTREGLPAWEGQHGHIPRGAWVLLRTGWSRRAGAKDFLNVGPDGPHSPGFHKDATLFLIHERDILGVGVETVGTDAGQAGTFDPPSPITP
jgi:kynurenine formamidase